MSNTTVVKTSVDESTTILAWCKKHEKDFQLDGDLATINLMVTMSRQLGGITPPNLDAALKMCLHSVKWLPGCEHPIIRREMADKAELERKRKRDAEVKAFIGTDQRKVKTEFDRAEAKTVDASKNAETEKIRRLQAEQSESKEEFERLANTYTVNRGGRVDYATTKNRRQALRETKTIIKNGVVRYDLMLDVAKQMVDKFEGSRQNITF